MARSVIKHGEGRSSWARAYGKQPDKFAYGMLKFQVTDYTRIMQNYFPAENRPRFMKFLHKLVYNQVSLQSCSIKLLSILAMFLMEF